MENAKTTVKFVFWIAILHWWDFVAGIMYKLRYTEVTAA